jgi:DNA-binding transcriptional regulator of glucitol operon
VIPNIFIAAGVVWVFLSILSYLQFVQLRSIYNILTEKGRIVTGQDRGLFRTKYRLFAAVSMDGTVRDVRILKVVRFITPPRIVECPQLIGLDLNRFDSAALDTEPRIQEAAENVRRSWVKLKPTINHDILSVAPKPGNVTVYEGPYTTGGQKITDNEYLGRAEQEIRGLLTNDELTINKEPLEKLLDVLFACDQTRCFSTDEVIADKALQLRAALTLRKAVDIPKVDGLVETIFRLIAQREREAGFRR